MNYAELEEAKATFRYKEIEQERKAFYNKRLDFVKYFNPKKILCMSIDEYVIGKSKFKTGRNFCYEIERTLDKLGRILGSTSVKFGVYYSSSSSNYKYTKKYGQTPNEAFKNIKNCISQLYKDGKNDDYQKIIDNPLSTMFKGKILSTYFPDKYLNVFSEEHLNHYLKELDLDNPKLMKSDPFYKRQALVEFRNNDKDMKTWTLDMFSVFLYRQYPKAPKKQNQSVTPKSIYEDLVFPTNEGFEEVTTLALIGTSANSSSTAKKTSSRTKDYEKESKRAKRIGDRGEKIVYDFEIDRVTKLLKQAEKKVRWVSRESDSFGYDILSVNDDGSERYIEVKATTGKVGDTNFYYTAHELATAKEKGAAYYIYIVYDIMSKKPKIWQIQNPFCNKSGVKLDLIPIQYIVPIKTKKK